MSWRALNAPDTAWIPIAASPPRDGSSDPNASVGCEEDRRRLLFDRLPDGTQDRVDDAAEEDLGDDRDDRDKKAVRLRDRTSRDPRSSARFRA
jgi:hypothetical protein